ncbi:probable rRNA maturation factor [Nitrosomonas cryotolerans]|uniref:Endoribonuclease YbeY n=1 Tax=Nitrosomonas cryotolerans ATCC 49181 TaxID=1131553 RepID=A0A1N6GRS9_9PROT|nr:rRNA maturation RNase YbeY [Nitrosomonas cryotolerans]SFP40097.1 probable rRNA maturation factor [Nitrosomonas cryotolerans]SIO10207.1 probable rRNA maturation factor [Nitrosomonas cryotolerans ATCC 49181]
MEKKLKLTVQYATNIADIPTRQQFRRWIKAALMQAAEITLRIVDESEGCDLNYHFRGKNSATNVLTFVYDDTQPLSGDIVLCTAIIEQEAQQQHKNLTAHYAHLTVHGVLHLQGYDHQNDTEAAIMEQLETEIITKLGYDNPYKEQ